MCICTTVFSWFLWKILTSELYFTLPTSCDSVATMLHFFWQSLKGYQHYIGCACLDYSGMRRCYRKCGCQDCQKPAACQSALGHCFLDWQHCHYCWNPPTVRGMEGVMKGYLTQSWKFLIYFMGCVHHIVSEFGIDLNQRFLTNVIV